MTGSPTASAKPSSEYHKLGKIGAKEIFKSSYASIDAAVLVFYHSILDAAALDYCRVTALHAPQDWEKDLNNTQVLLVEAKSKTYDQLLQDKLHQRLKQLERESPLDKVIACLLDASAMVSDERLFLDLNQIKQFDDQRHAIVHGDALGKSLSIYPASDEKFSDLQQTGMYFMGLINFRYKLRIKPERLVHPRSTTATGYSTAHLRS